MEKTSIIKIKVLKTRPTQLALGMKEVQMRAEKLRSLKGKELEKYLEDHLAPIVKWQRHDFVVDRHHFLRSCWEADLEDAYGELKADLSHLSYAEMWQTMNSAHWVYPYDQFGNGPHPTTHLPEDVRGMADDPYRSLAWMIREKGGFLKVKEPFSEFIWANFLRKKLTVHPVIDGYDLCTKEGLKLCRSPEAKDLPGYKK